MVHTLLLCENIGARYNHEQESWYHTLDPWLTLNFPDRIHNPYEQSPWDDMMTIKQKILRLWDGAASAVKLCCIKFAQRVVLAQTTAVNMDKVRFL